MVHPTHSQSVVHVSLKREQTRAREPLASIPCPRDLCQPLAQNRVQGLSRQHGTAFNPQMVYGREGASGLWKRRVPSGPSSAIVVMEAPADRQCWRSLTAPTGVPNPRR